MSASRPRMSGRLARPPEDRLTGIRRCSPIDPEELTPVSDSSLQQRVKVHISRIARARVAEHRPGLTSRGAQSTARIRQCRGVAGFVLGPRPHRVEDTKRPVSLAGLDQKEGRGAAQTVDTHISHAATEDEDLLEDRSRARIIAGGKRHARETAQCYEASPGRGASARQRGGLGEQVTSTSKVSAHDFDASADRERIGNTFVVIWVRADVCKLIRIALRLVDGTILQKS